MGRTRIGGVTVAQGGNVKWGLLFSIIFGSGVYAYFEGIISLVIGFREFVFQDLLGGVRSFVVTLIDLEFTVAGTASQLAWQEFWRAIRPHGLAAWILAIIAVAFVLLLFVLLVRKGVSAIGG